jgi:hypothetical protein
MIIVDVEYSKKEIRFDKELSELDRFVVKFTDILNKAEVRYVVVSGYVSILFGRSRSSEDVDILLEKLNPVRFEKVWKTICRKFECVNVSDKDDAYKNYLTTGHSVRFSERGKFIPNMEVKFPKTELDEWTLKERKKVKVKNKIMYISPLELQIPYKLFLGSEKDIEDAKYLHTLFKGKVDVVVMEGFISQLGVKSLYTEYLR